MRVLSSFQAFNLLERERPLRFVIPCGFDDVGGYLPLGRSFFLVVALVEDFFFCCFGPFNGCSARTASASCASMAFTVSGGTPVPFNCASFPAIRALRRGPGVGLEIFEDGVRAGDAFLPSRVLRMTGEAFSIRVVERVWRVAERVRRRVVGRRCCS
jgi:hypothetical protein